MFMKLYFKKAPATFMLLASSVFVLNALPVNVAYAGCSPKCPSGETCRYEAAGGKYYCEVSKSARKGALGGKLKQMQVEGAELDSRGDGSLLK